jgi:hypothetical protein|tara:strand:- start:10117 stop:10362 length:246 start_codon:yes stop_codon:yes gene_type:complete
MNDPRALKGSVSLRELEEVEANLLYSRCMGTVTAMKRARNPEFRALWRRIYEHLVCDDSLDAGEAVCMDISARDEFNKPLP